MAKAKKSMMPKAMKGGKKSSGKPVIKATKAAKSGGKSTRGHGY